MMTTCILEREVLSSRIFELTDSLFLTLSSSLSLSPSLLLLLSSSLSLPAPLPHVHLEQAELRALEEEANSGLLTSYPFQPTPNGHTHATSHTHTDHPQNSSPSSPPQKSMNDMNTSGDINTSGQGASAGKGGGSGGRVSSVVSAFDQQNVSVFDKENQTGALLRGQVQQDTSPASLSIQRCAACRARAREGEKEREGGGGKKER